MICLLLVLESNPLLTLFRSLSFPAPPLVNRPTGQWGGARIVLRPTTTLAAALHHHPLSPDGGVRTLAQGCGRRSAQWRGAASVRQWPIRWWRYGQMWSSRYRPAHVRAQESDDVLLPAQQPHGQPHPTVLHLLLLEHESHPTMCWMWQRLVLRA